MDSPQLHLPPQEKLRNRDRLPQTPEQVAHDWSFLKRWLKGDIDAEPLSVRQTELLYCHHITGLARETMLRESGWEAVAKQKRRQMVSGMQSSVMYEKLARICWEQGIPILPVKGVSLLLGIFFNDPGRRQISDIDFLVRPYDLPALATILEKEGYVVKNPQMLTQIYQQNKPKAEFISPAGKLPPLDVHTAFIVKKFLSQHSDIPLNDVFGRSRSIQGSKGPVKVLDPVDEWIYMACHFCLHHRFAGLKWLDDLQQTAAQFTEKEWQAMAGRVEVAGLKTVVTAVLMLMEKVYGVSAQVLSLFPGQRLSWMTRIWLEDALLPEKISIRSLEHGQETWIDRLGSFFWEFLFIDDRKSRRTALRRLLFLNRGMLSAIIGPISPFAYIFAAPIAILCSGAVMTVYYLESLRRLVFRR